MWRWSTSSGCTPGPDPSRPHDEVLLDSRVLSQGRRSALLREDRLEFTAPPTRQTSSARQRQLLTLLDALGGCIENLDFQKLLFLYCREQGGASTYEFVPYKYGAFSFTSYADRRKLVARGLLADDENLWRLTDAGSEMLEHTRDLLLSAFVRRYASLRGDELVAESYRRFPYYATRSEIADRVLQGDTTALKQIEIASRSPSTAACLCTIGYEGRTLEGYLNVLIRAEVHLLCEPSRSSSATRSLTVVARSATKIARSGSTPRPQSDTCSCS